MSSDIIVVIGAITSVTAFSKRLKKFYKIPSKIVHTPSVLGGGGCSYSLLLNKNYLREVEEVSKNFKIKIKGIYSVEKQEKKEVYHVIS